MTRKNLIEQCQFEAIDGHSFKTTLVSRNVTIMGRRTSIRLEPEMWQALKEISEREGCSIHDICSLVSMRKKAKTSLTAAIRVFIMLYFRASSTEQGHIRAGHGNFRLMIKRARLDESSLPLKKRIRLKRESAGHENPAVYA